MGRRCRGHSASTPQPCHPGVDSHPLRPSGVLSAPRLHKTMTFGFRQLSFPLRHGAGCFLSGKWEVDYVYVDTAEPLAGLVPPYANTPCWWVCVGMGQDVVSFVLVTL